MLLILTGIALLGAAAVAVAVTEQVRDFDPEELSRRRLFAAYAGGAAGIAGTAAILVGLLLLTVHRVVPQRGVRGSAVRGEGDVPAAEPDHHEPPTVRLADQDPPTVRLSGSEATVRLPSGQKPPRDPRATA
jgi:hypothetical protein